MTLGNCMRGNIVALDACYGRLRSQRRVYQGDLLLGATRFEALRPFTQEALRASLAPMIATMATLGIVSLPGMMTGQILGGSSPIVAIKYQIAIMVCIFVVMALSAMLNLILTQRVAFDHYDRLREDIFVA
jgi:putative ABC transport system permease protein